MIEDYISKYSEEQDDVLSWLEKQTNLRTNHARMLCGNIEGKLLEFITSMIGAKNILEIGTFTGYSTICLARGTSNDGIIDAIEINDELEDLIREGYARAGVEKKINLIFGNAIEIIPKLNKEYDLVFIDANKREYCDYYNAIIDKVRLGGYIIADNVLWSGKVENNKLENAKDPQTQGILLFNQMVKNDKRVENIILPLRDGINIIKKLITTILNRPQIIII
jgi:Predicted O-methyltransferase